VGTGRGTRHHVLERREGSDRQRHPDAGASRLPGRHHLPPAAEPELARIRGVEAEVELRLARKWRLLGSYLFTDARVVDASRQPALEGKRLAQVPTHAFSLGARYQNPALVNVALTGRYVGNQFEDDLNTLPLGSFFVVDVLFSRPVTRWGELFLAVENVFNETYAVGRTSEGVVTIGAPRLVRGGVRLAF
jgi:outer membrane receptor protein involved in Fe transport